jgi:hypothetical protein
METTNGPESRAVRVSGARGLWHAVAMGDDLDEDDYQAREMYAGYGLAMYYAQVLERALANAITMAQSTSAEFGTRTDSDGATFSKSGAVVDELVDRLGPFVADDVDLVADLEKALELRTEFAHHFFWKHVVDADSREGRERMIAESEEAKDRFWSTTERLEPVLRRFLESLGISPETYARNVRSTMAEMPRDAQQPQREAEE